MFDITAIIDSIANSVANQVGGAISGVIGSISNGISKYVIQPVTTDISSVLGTIGGTLSSLETSASQGITSTLSAVGNGLAQVENQVAGGFTVALGAVSQGISTAEQAIVNTFNEVVAGIEAGFSDISGGIQQTLKSYQDVLSNVFTQWGKAFTDVFTTTVEPLIHFIEQLPADITQIADKIGADLEATGKSVATIAEKIVSYVESHAGMAVKDIQYALDPKTWIGPKQLFGSTFFDLIAEVTGLDISKADPVAIGRLAAGMTGEFIAASAVPFDEGLAFMLGRQLPPLIDVAMRGSWRDLEQMANAGVPNVLIPIGELIDSRFKKIIDDAYFYDQMERHGISDKNADVLYNAAYELLGLSDLVQLFKRGEIKDTATLYAKADLVHISAEKVDAALALYNSLIGTSESINLWRRGIVPEGFTDSLDDARREGWTKERLDALLAASYTLPAIAEFHRFTRQQVDDPAVVEKYQYDYLMTPEYLALAKAHGFTEENAKRIWRASWAIPPFFITESLYRTGEMNEDTFRYFLKQEGYTPPVQDMLIEQLKPRLKATDIKEAYKYQVITADKIVPKLVSIGMPSDVAEETSKIWQASVKLAAPLDQNGAQAAALKVKEETISLVKTAYKDKILTKDAAMAHLKSLNVTPEAATLILEIADYEVMQVTIKDTYAIVKADIASGNMTLNDAINMLTQAGASTFQLDLYTAELQRVGLAKPRTPTLAEFNAWYKKGIIDAQELYNGLSFIGWSDNWIPFFMSEAGVAAKDIQSIVPNASSPI